MLTSENIRKILCSAISSEILLLTSNESLAYDLCKEINFFMKHTLGLNSNGYRYTLFAAAFKPIVVCSLDQWNNKKLPDNPFVRVYRGDFYGTVLVTDKSIANSVKNVAKGIRIKYCPIDETKKYAPIDETLEKLLAKFDETIKNIEYKIRTG